MSPVDGFTLDEAAHINKAVLATERIGVPIVPMPIADDLGRPWACPNTSTRTRACGSRGSVSPDEHLGAPPSDHIGVIGLSTDAFQPRSMSQRMNALSTAASVAITIRVSDAAHPAQDTSTGVLHELVTGRSKPNHSI